VLRSIDLDRESKWHTREVEDVALEWMLAPEPDAKSIAAQLPPKTDLRVVHRLAVLTRVANERSSASHGFTVGDSSDSFSGWLPPYLRAFGSQGPFPHSVGEQ
jgi:hypothetical protein